MCAIFLLDLLFVAIIEESFEWIAPKLLIHGSISGTLVILPLIVYHKITGRDLTDVTSAPITHRDVVPLIASFMLYAITFYALGLVVNICEICTDPHIYTMCYVAIILFILDFWLIWFGFLVIPGIIGKHTKIVD